MSGLELLTELRTRGARSPEIVITTNDATEVRKEAERCRAAAYLAKLFIGSALLAAIKSLDGASRRT